jgi:hypothetical protein
LLRHFCRSRVVVDHVQSPIGEHITEVATGAPGALHYLSNRFAGVPPVDNCPALLQ